MFLLFSCVESLLLFWVDSNRLVQVCFVMRSYVGSTPLRVTNVLSFFVVHVVQCCGTDLDMLCCELWHGHEKEYNVEARALISSEARTRDPEFVRLMEKRLCSWSCCWISRADSDTAMIIVLFLNLLSWFRNGYCRAAAPESGNCPSSCGCFEDLYLIIMRNMRKLH